MLTGPIPEFDWEIGSDDAPIQDDPALEDFNVQKRIDEFILECLVPAAEYRGV